jgi:antitoxin MazE
MQIAVRKLGNSVGVIIPKAFLAELRLVPGDAVDIRLEDGQIVLAPIRRPSRTGWREASRVVAERGDDAPVWPELSNTGDTDLSW